MTLPAPERTRLRTARDRVVAYLLAHGTATNAELWAIGGNAAIRRLWEAQDELSQQGYRVDKVHERGGRWRYRLRRANVPQQLRLREADRV